MLSAFDVHAKEKRELLERNLAIMKAAWAGNVVGAETLGAVMAPRPAAAASSAHLDGSIRP